MKDLLFVDRKHQEAKSPLASEPLFEAFPAKLVGRASNELVIYIHIPFCYQKCVYCFFSTVSKYTEDDLDTYVSLLIHEIQQIASLVEPNRIIRSVYFGGGTPLNLGLGRLEQVYRQITSHFSIDETTEISIELDPATTRPQDLISLQEIGFNRFSFGVQFFDADSLRRAGRKPIEDFASLLAVIPSKTLVSFDLMLGFPAFQPDVFWASLKTALKYNPGAITIYPLAIKRGSAVYKQMENNTFVPPDWQKVDDFLKDVGTYLDDQGYTQHTLWSFISNNQTSHCLYEELSWCGCDALGVGAGAVSHYGNLSFKNTPVTNIEGRLHYEFERGIKLTDDQCLAQLLVSGLRMKQLALPIVKQYLQVEPGQIIDRLDALNILSFFDVENNMVKWKSPSVIKFKEDVCASIIQSHEGEAFTRDFWYVP